MRSIPVLLLGIGGVGRQLLDRIVSCRSLHSKQGLALRVVGICDSRSLLAVEDVFKLELTDESLKEICRSKSSGSPLSSLMNLGQCQVFKDSEARKKEDFDKLMSDFRRIRFESTVGAGLPVIVSVTRMISSGDSIHQIIGSLSGTLGYVMSELEDGKSFSFAVQEAKRLGYTEPDPRDDLSGMDVARKALILSRLLGHRINLEDIKVDSLYPDEMGPKSMSIVDFMSLGLPLLDREVGEKVGLAASKGNVLRYACVIQDSRCQVGLHDVPNDSPLGRLRGSDNVVEVYSRCYERWPLAIQGAGAGNDATAAGVLADIIDLQDIFV